MKSGYFHLLLILTLLAMLPSAYSAGLNSASALTIGASIKTPVTFITKPDSTLNYLKINYTWLPIDDYRQSTSSLNTYPPSTIKDGATMFTINDLSNFDMAVSFKVKTTSEPVKVTTKEPFPIKNLDPSLIEYTKPTKLIDINPDIKNTASKLAQGDDDEYEVVFKVADWVNTNIEYNLSTVTSEASLPASWVFKNRYGVCDEMSNLFVAMVRSLGIPARVVSGISYTNSDLFAQPWGAHGWTEVYFPDYGWVPFDPTYGQFGFVDATHIKLEEGVESRKFNTRYSWKGNNVDVTSGKQQISASVIHEAPKSKSNINMKINMLSNKTAFGSYNVVMAKITNLKDYYVGKSVSLSDTESINLVSEKRQDFFLKPHETKKIHWIIHVNNRLKKSYVYTFPISVYTSDGDVANTTFIAQDNGEFMSEDTANTYSIKPEYFKASGLKLDCSSEKNAIYENENITINCSLNADIVGNARVCIDGSDCIVLTPEEQTKFTLSKKPVILGFQTRIVQAKIADRLAESFVSVDVLDNATILINNLEYSNNMTYEGSQTLKFSLSKNSSSTPLNITASLNANNFFKQWKMNGLYDTQNFTDVISGNDLSGVKNKLLLNIVYFDKAGKRYEINKDINIDLENLTSMQQINIYLTNILSWISRLFSNIG